MDTEELKIQNKTLEMELLKIYFEEWKFRQENLWKRMTSFFIIIFFVSTLTITAYMFSGLSIPDISPSFFPICGLILSMLYLWYCFAESHRINAIDELAREIIKTNFPSKYTKRGLRAFQKYKNQVGVEPKEKAWKIFQFRMSIWVPLVLTAFEIAVAITMLILISQKVI